MEELKAIQNKYRREPLPDDWAPWTPICDNCGKIITPRVTKFEGGKVHYKCEDYQFEKYTAKGCGHEGTNDPLKGNGKLMWKSEWAAQWARWNIVSEGAGKEYQVPGSAFWVNAEICERILGFPSPVPIFYEHLIINGKKMSASLGNVVYPADWLRHAPAELLRLLFLKDPMRERDFRWDFVPNMMDEVDELERVYYGVKKLKSDRDSQNAKRLFQMIGVKPLPKKYVPAVGFGTLVELARTMPSKNQLDFIATQVERLGLVDKATPDVRKRLEQRLGYARAYIENVETKGRYNDKEKIKLTAEQASAIKKLIAAIEKENDADKLQNKIFELAKSSGMKPAEFFRLVYTILFSAERGPRLGSYIIDAGKGEIIKKLKDAM
jgi:lysyl-tRNA synthetase class 1